MWHWNGFLHRIRLHGSLIWRHRWTLTAFRFFLHKCLDRRESGERGEKVSQYSHPSYHLKVWAHLKQPVGWHAELCCPLPLHSLPLSYNIKLQLWQLRRSSWAVWERAPQPCTAGDFGSFSLMQGRKETKKDVAHPQFCPTPCLFSLLSSPAAGSWKKKEEEGSDKMWAMMMMTMMMLRLGGSEGPAINNNVEMSTGVHRVAEMKGAGTFNETVLHICQKNHTSDMFCRGRRG